MLKIEKGWGDDGGEIKSLFYKGVLLINYN